MSERRVYLACDPADALEVSRLLQRAMDSLSYSYPVKEVISIGIDEASYRTPADESEILRRIRAQTLKDSTITIAAIGRCTHSLRSLDWEVKASLFHEGNQAPNGLVAVALPKCSRNEDLPPRLLANVSAGPSAYAQFWTWPADADQWRYVIEDAFVARVRRSAAIRNEAPLMQANVVCRNCGVVHER